MKRYRLTIGAMMGLVLLLAVAFAALRSAKLLWASATFTATVTVLSVATLVAVAARGPSRLPWVGFAVFGWVYLVTTFWLWPGNNGVTAPPYLTKLLMDYAMPMRSNASFIIVETGPQGDRWSAYSPKVGPTQRVVYLHEYRRIGHTLTANLFGLAGALIGRYLSSRERTSE